MTTDETEKTGDVATAIEAGGALYGQLYAAGSDSIRRRIENFDGAPDPGGDFDQAARDGDIAEAFYRADLDNSRVMLDALGEEVIVAALVADGGRTTEAARRYVADRKDLV